MAGHTAATHIAELGREAGNKTMKTIIDRALKHLGLARRSLTVFSGAQGSRLTMDWIASILSADQEVKSNLRLLRARAREFSRNNPVAKSYLTMCETNIVGKAGIRYESKVRDSDKTLSRGINRQIEDAFEDWGRRENCTIDGRHSFRALQSLAVRTKEADGEFFLRMVRGFDGNPYRFALQLIDADQVDHLYNVESVERRGPRSPSQYEIRMGVEVDRWGRPIAYWITPRHPSDAGGSTLRERVPADQIIHLYDSGRVNQTRGITAFHAVMMHLRMLDGYVEAELVAARTAAAKMGFLTYTDTSAFEAPNDNLRNIRIEAKPGVIETLPPGMDFKEWSPQHPAVVFGHFTQGVLRLIASGLGVSYNALANDLIGVTYSSMRSGLLVERDNWRCQQLILAF
jgi:lambda family phage portal protein